MVSTGWSHNDTAPSGPSAGSKTEHPPTAKGLDPTKPDTSQRSPCRGVALLRARTFLSSAWAIDVLANVGTCCNLNA